MSTAQNKNVHHTNKAGGRLQSEKDKVPADNERKIRGYSEFELVPERMTNVYQHLISKRKLYTSRVLSNVPIPATYW